VEGMIRPTAFGNSNGWPQRRGDTIGCDGNITVGTTEPGSFESMRRRIGATAGTGQGTLEGNEAHGRRGRLLAGNGDSHYGPDSGAKPRGRGSPKRSPATVSNSEARRRGGNDHSDVARLLTGGLLRGV